jgi:hypothetical protein
MLAMSPPGATGGAEAAGPGAGSGTLVQAASKAALKARAMKWRIVFLRAFLDERM